MYWNNPRMMRIFFALVLITWHPFIGCLDDSSLPDSEEYRILHRSIIGGKPDLRYPEIGALTVNQRNFCTGTLIAKRVVLTAGHCVDAALRYLKKGAKLQFRIDIPSSTTTDGYVKKFFDFDPKLFSRHPKWKNSLQAGYDIAIGILKQKVTIVRPMAVNFMPLGQNWVGRKLLFLGYGIIQSVPVAVSPHRKYAVELPIIRVLHDRYTTQAPGQSVCHGDSGGPSLYRINGQMRVLGVNSYVSAPRVPGSNPPRSSCSGSGTSMRTDAYANYIRSILQKYGDGGLACSKDEECGSCHRCVKNHCAVIPIKANKNNCHPCRTDADCQGGICQRFKDGYRCLQRCTKTGCCPEDTYCDLLQTAKGLEQLCLPYGGLCPALSCRRDKDCGPGEGCENGHCLPKAVPRSPQLCRTCQKHSDCGKDHLCLGLKGHKRCAQPCAFGNFCPPEFTCQTPYHGAIPQCLPISGACQKPCMFNSHCPKGTLCLNGSCAEPQGQNYGDPCDPTPCRQGLSCLPTITGKRCLYSCGVPAGFAGSACSEKGKCEEGLVCHALSSELKLCLRRCSSNDQCFLGGGGICSQGICTCHQDSDCASGYICNRASLVLGACVPKKSVTSCPNQLKCRYSRGLGYCVEGNSGNRQLGQSCDALNECQKNLECVFNKNAQGMCFEKCTQGSPCQSGGKCIGLSSGTSVCMCQEGDSSCPSRRTCKKHAERYGVCVPKGFNDACLSDAECPENYRCVRGRCYTKEELEKIKFEPIEESFPEDGGEELISESTQNSSERSSEKSYPDALPESPSEPTTTKREALHRENPKTRPEKNSFHEGKISDDIKEKVISAGGCGCSVQQGENVGVGGFLFLLIFVMLFMGMSKRRFSWKRVERHFFKMFFLSFVMLSLSASSIFMMGCSRDIPQSEGKKERLKVDGGHRKGEQVSEQVLSKEESLLDKGKEGSIEENIQHREERSFRDLVKESIQREEKLEAGEEFVSDDGGEVDEGIPEPLVELPPKQKVPACSQTTDKRCCTPSVIRMKKLFSTTGSSYMGSLKIAVSSDGKYLASADTDGWILRVWRLSDRRLIYALQGHTSAVRALAFSPDNKMLASVSWDRTIRLWDLKAGKQIALLKGHRSGIYSVAFSHDGSLLATGSSDRTVRIWDLKTKTLKKTLVGHKGTIYAVVFSKDDSQVISGCSDKTVIFWNVASGQKLATFTGMQDRVYDIALSKDGKYLAIATGYRDKSIRLVDTSTFKLSSQWPAKGGSTYKVRFSPDGRWLAGIASDRKLWIWQVSTGQMVRNVRVGEDYLQGLAFDPSGKTIYTASRDQTIRAWHLTDAKEIWRLHSHFDRSIRAVFSPDGRYIATSHPRLKTIRIWQVAGERYIRQLSGEQFGIRALKFSPDGKWLAGAGNEGVIRLWDWKTGRVVRTFSGHKMPVTDLVFSKDSKLLASSSWDRSLILWSVDTGKKIRSFVGHNDVVTSVDFNHDASQLLSTSVDKTIRIWKVADGTSLRVIRDDSWVYVGRFQPKGPLIATGNWKGDIELWDRTTGKLIRRLQGHKSNVRSLVFSSSGDWLVSASYDWTARQWQVKDGALIRMIYPRYHRVSSVDLSNDGHHLLTTTWDGNTDIWAIQAPPQSQSLTSLKQGLHDLLISPDGTFYVVGFADGSVEMRDSSKHTLIRQFTGASSSINALALSEDRRLVAAVGDDRIARVWQIDNGQLLRTFRGHQDTISSVAFDAERRYLATGSWDGTVKIWDLASGRLTRTLRAAHSRVLSLVTTRKGRVIAGLADGQILVWELQSGKFLQKIQGEHSGIIRLVLSPSQEILYSASYGGKISKWSLIYYRLLNQIQASSKMILALAIAQDGLSLLSGGADGSIRIWNASNLTALRSYDLNSGIFTALHLFQSQQMLWAASESGSLLSLKIASFLKEHSFYTYGLSILSSTYNARYQLLSFSTAANLAKVYRAGSWRYVRSFYGHSSDVRTVAIHPRGQQIATGSFDKKIRIASLANGKTLFDLTEHSKGTTELVYSRDGRFLASASDDKTIKLWRYGQKSSYLTLKGHQGAVLTLAFHPNSRTLASGSTDKTVMIWDSTTGHLLHTLKSHQGSVLSIRYHPSGQLLGSVSSDKTLKIWQASSGSLLTTVKLGDEPLRLRFSPDGFWLAISYRNGWLKLFDTKQWKVRSSFLVSHAPLRAISWISQALFIGDNDGWGYLFSCP